MYADYLVKRFRRLIIPTWIYIGVYVVFFAILYSCGISEHEFNKEEVINSFLLLDGFGYVWVIRIYFMMAIIAPALFWVSRLPVYLSTLFWCIGLFIHICIVSIRVDIHNVFLYKCWCYIILYIMAYALIYYAGISICKYKKIYVLLVSGIMFGVCLIFFMKVNAFDIQTYKYPPKYIYIFYGISISILIYYFSKTKIGQRLSEIKGVRYLSKNSLSIYFIHTFVIGLFEYKVLTISTWIGRYISTLIASVAIQLVYSFLLEYIKERRKTCVINK